MNRELEILKQQMVAAHHQLDMLNAPRKVAGENLTVAGRLEWVREHYIYKDKNYGN